VRSIAIDTNAYTALKAGQGEVVEVLRHAPEIQVSTTVLGELLAGFAAGTRTSANRADLHRFLSTPRVRLLACGAATADLYARIYAELRRRGRPIPTNDLWIAASCMEHGAALLTLDRHFDDVGGLSSGACLDDFLP
jgi:tRNA(fMet)-specific endonuclease VapC